MLVVRDSDEEKTIELVKENQLLRTIIDSIHEGVFVTNEKNEIILYNQEVEKTEGLKRENVLGKTEDQVYLSADYNFNETVTKKVLRTGKPVMEQFHKYKLENGHQMNVIYSTFPFYYQGKIAAVYSIGRDINQINRFILNTLEMENKLKTEENTVRQIGARYFLDDIVGISANIHETVLLARKVARHNSPVLIVGETGTGKEIFAHGMHNSSCYAKGPFIPVNCAAIPDTLLESVLFGSVKGAFTGAGDIPGLFEQAEGGTIFLDEINSMPFSLQAKLLRVLQDKSVRRIGSKEEISVNCRVISATNIDPFDTLNEKIIRPDLFFRLATVAINIPPLRERKVDIQVLCKHFINKYNNEFGFIVEDVSSDLLSLFEKYHWPGNVRELENIIESAMNLMEPGEKILAFRHIPNYYHERLNNYQQNSQNRNPDIVTLHDALLEFEKKFIEEALASNDNNITQTAKVLGISRQHLHLKLKTHKILKNFKRNGIK